MGKREVLRKKRQKEKTVSILRWVLGSLIVAMAVGGLIFSQQLVALFTPAPVDDIKRAPSVARPLVDGNSMGDPKAPVEIVNFSNFQCVHCSRFAVGDTDGTAGNKITESDIIKAYIDSGKARFTYIPYSWAPETEFSAEEAAYCAGDQGRFWEFRDMVFLNANNTKIGGINRKNLTAFAEVLNLDMNAFEQCFEGHEYLQQVSEDVTYAKDSGLEATPSFMVNGKMVFSSQLATAIDAALQQGSTPPTAAPTLAVSSTPTMAATEVSRDGIILPPPITRYQVAGNSMGDPQAPVKVEEFSNYLCIHCSRFAVGGFTGESSGGLNEEVLFERFISTDLVYYTYIPYSWSPGEAFSAEAASYCAAEQGRFWEFRDLVFLNHNNSALSGNNQTDMTTLARALGLDMTRFLSCFENDQYGQQVIDNVNYAKSVGLEGTPSFLVNGRLVFAGQLEAAIVDALRQAGASVPTALPTTAPTPAPPLPATAGPAAVAIQASAADVVLPPDINRPMVDDDRTGNPQAKVKVEYFASFDCPICASFATGEGNDYSETRLRDEYLTGGKVQYRYFPYSWNPETAQSPEEATYCAMDQGKFWEFRDAVFLNKGNNRIGGIHPGSLTAIADALGLDMVQFNSCFSSQKYHQHVLDNITYAHENGPINTLYFRVNDQVVSQAKLKSTIEQELAKP